MESGYFTRFEYNRVAKMDDIRKRDKEISNVLIHHRDSKEKDAA